MEVGNFSEFFTSGLLSELENAGYSVIISRDFVRDSDSVNRVSFDDFAVQDNFVSLGICYSVGEEERINKVYRSRKRMRISLYRLLLPCNGKLNRLFESFLQDVFVQFIEDLNKGSS